MQSTLPVTVTVTERGVTIEGRGKVIAMSTLSARATRLAADFGPGSHVIATNTDAADLDYTGGPWQDIMEALS